MKFLVTVKLAKNPQHNPRQKQSGPCPVSGMWCTDVTGEHHTVMVEAEDVDEARAMLMEWSHITRIEQVEA